ncbi:MAG: hypothetical protein KDD27_04375, partial [Saprospiraceae bacterium]|nr:hypothetical protein [Saprospiraceae bacterium]
LTLPLLALALLLLAGCAKDEAPATTALQENQDVPADVQAIVDEATAELEYDYTHPASNGEIGSRATVYLPAGSTDGLQAAIQQAGPNGKVVVASGIHYESGTVTVSQPGVRITGATGAVIYFDVAKSGGNIFGTVTNVLDPALYILNANFVRVEGLTILPQKQTGNVGIYLENAQHARLEKNNLKDFQYAVFVTGNSTYAGIYDNHIETTVTSGDRSGVVIHDGKYAKLKGNFVSGFTWDFFLSSSACHAMDNELVNGVVGILFCTFQGNMLLPNGDMLPKAVSATKWKAIQNNAHHNFINYLLIDGANDNFLFRNDASSAGSYDVIYNGPTILGGAPALPASNNFVVNPSSSTTYQDCGVNNTTLAGTEIPCP